MFSIKINVVLLDIEIVFFLILFFYTALNGILIEKYASGRKKDCVDPGSTKKYILKMIKIKISQIRYSVFCTDRAVILFRLFRGLNFTRSPVTHLSNS